MPDIASWVTPLLILPGVGLLLVSTAARYEAIHAEIHVLLHAADAGAAACARHVVERARRLRTALVWLYVAAALLATSGLVAAMTAWWSDAVHAASWVLLGAGVTGVVVATSVLARESAVSLRVIEAHADEIAERSASHDPD